MTIKSSWCHCFRIFWCSSANCYQVHRWVCMCVCVVTSTFPVSPWGNVWVPTVHCWVSILSFCSLALISVWGVANSWTCKHIAIKVCRLLGWAKTSTLFLVLHSAFSGALVFWVQSISIVLDRTPVSSCFTSGTWGLHSSRLYTSPCFDSLSWGQYLFIYRAPHFSGKSPTSLRPQLSKGHALYTCLTIPYPKHTSQLSFLHGGLMPYILLMG